MKRLIPVLFALFAGITVFAQTQYEVLIGKPNEKTLKGIISKEILTKDTSFTKWWNDGLKSYTPNASAIEGLKKHKDSIRLFVFMGTWCEDSHNIIPKFYTLLDAAGFPQDRVTLIGVDRNKLTLGHLSEVMNADKAPTIIVMKKGREQGRVIEFGKYGLFDMELAEILKAIE
jgi:hypothetical protein